MFKLQLKDNPNRSIWLVGDKVSIGSHADNTFVLDGLGIDEFHAELLIHPNHLILKSKPGSCIVNDLPVDDGFRLSANDELRIGKERLLIIDPKHPPQPPARKKPGAAKKTAVAADWVLVPDHPKLKELDFSIHERATLGRSKDCELAVPYKLLSREHAELRIENGELFVKDLGSANGCFVNGKRVQEAKLSNGDRVAFAKLVFLVQGPEQPEAVLTAKATSEEEMNRTMIRPAIDLETELEAQQASRMSNSIQLEAISDDNDSAEAEAGTAGGGKKIALVIVLLVIGVAVAAYVTQRV